MKVLKRVPKIKRRERELLAYKTQVNYSWLIVSCPFTKNAFVISTFLNFFIFFKYIKSLLINILKYEINFYVLIV